MVSTKSKTPIANRMSNTFIYEQGWLVGKPEMAEPTEDDIMFSSDYLVTYSGHLANLRRFKYDYPDPGKEMELGKDFRIEHWCNNHETLKGVHTKVMDINNDFSNYRQWCDSCYLKAAPIAPITQRTYSEQDLFDVWEAGGNSAYHSVKPIKQKIMSQNTLPDEVKPTPPKKLNDSKLLELVCQLHSRTLRFPNQKELHDAANEARKEMEKRLEEYAKAYAPVPGKEEVEKIADKIFEAGWSMGTTHRYNSVEKEKQIKEIIAGASFNSDDGKEDQYWSQAISMIEVADTDGEDYLIKYKELHEKLKSKFTISCKQNEIQQAHDKAQYE